MVSRLDSLLVDGLTDVLKNEADVYGEILKISRSKTDIIVAGKAAELEKLNRQEQAMVFQITDMEDVREKIIAKLAVQFQRKPLELTVSVLTGLLPEDKSQQLKDIHEKLLGTLKEIKGVNSLNSKLIRNSIDYIDFSINLITGAEASNNLYGNSGQTSEARKRNFFDVKL